MARLRRNKERPPQTIHMNVTLDQHEILIQNKIEKNEALYQVLQRILVRYQELEIINSDLKESLKESRILRANLETKLEPTEVIGNRRERRMI